MLEDDQLEEPEQMKERERKGDRTYEQVALGQQ